MRTRVSSENTCRYLSHDFCTFKKTDFSRSQQEWFFDLLRRRNYNTATMKFAFTLGKKLFKFSSVSCFQDFKSPFTKTKNLYFLALFAVLAFTVDARARSEPINNGTHWISKAKDSLLLLGSEHLLYERKAPHTLLTFLSLKICCSFENLSAEWKPVSVKRSKAKFSKSQQVYGLIF